MEMEGFGGRIPFEVIVIVIRVRGDPGWNLYVKIFQYLQREGPRRGLERFRDHDHVRENVDHVMKFICRFVHIRRISVRRQATHGQVDGLSHPGTEYVSTTVIVRQALDQDPRRGLNLRGQVFELCQDST